MSPQQTRAWLVAPDHDSAPEGVPLCASHADRISVPFGWTLTDDRPAPKKKRRRKRTTPTPEPVLSDVEPEVEPELTAAVTLGRASVEPATSAEPQPEPVVEPDAGIEQHEAPIILEAEPAVGAVTAGTEGSTDARPDEPALDPDPVDPDLVDPDYVPPEYQFRHDASDVAAADEPTIEMPAIGHEPATPAEVPVDADRVAAAVEEESPRLSVVPGDDDPDKTYGFSDAGQGALWNEPEPADIDPDESTPLLKRAFRVVRDD